ncbi:MAG: hypothetical protein CVV60_04635, partial [Tenericutes bacterium HGW-Tenericutes-5]
SLRAADLSSDNSLKNLLNQAKVVWNMTPECMENNPLPLTLNGDVKVEKLDFLEDANSWKTTAWNYAVVLDQSSHLSMDAEKVSVLRPQGNEVSLYVRAWMDNDAAGTFFFSDFLTLGIHPSGLAIAFLGVKTENGKVYREIPLANVDKNKWLDLIIRTGNGYLDFFCNGIRKCSIPVSQELCSSFLNDLYLGAYGWHKGMDQYFVRSCEKGIKKIAVVALWHSLLSDKQIAILSNVNKVDADATEGPFEVAVKDYNKFFDASLDKDTAECNILWKSLRKTADEDPLRPTFHLTQPFGWIFDPAGAYYFNGLYHVFSYHNIYAQLSYNSLDHYVSEDLVHWTQWPIGPWADCELDNFGIWLMNHFLDEKGIPCIIYTGIGSNAKDRSLTQTYSKASWGGCGILSRSYDGLISYEEKKPVLTRYHHDGHTWKEGDTWHSITSKRYGGARAGTLGDAVMLWSSKDLETWEELGEIFAQQKYPHSWDKTGGMEFPYLLSYGEKDVMILGGFPVRYWIGEFDTDQIRFIPDNQEGLLLDYTNPFHCFNPLCVDNKGPDGSERRIIMAMLNSLGGGGNSLLPWMGVHTIPRILKLEGGRLSQEPVPELQILRGEHSYWKNLPVSSKSDINISHSGDAVEIIAEFEPGDATRFGLKFRMSEDKSRFVRIYFDSITNEFGVDGNVLHKGSGPSYITAGKTVIMHIFIDKQMVEVFVNGQTCTTASQDRDFPGAEIELFSEGGTSRCSKLDIWKMNPSLPR